METIYNNTFTNGSNCGLTRYNACVGNNGKFDGKYFHGYDLSVKILCKSLFNDTTEIDQLIFPILFNARHAIELYLKDALYNLYRINESLDFIKSIDIDVDRLQKTHDLSILWQMFESNSIKLDRRIQMYIDFQKEYITDYFDIDLTGETFRYQYTKENVVHLAETPLVNVVLFYKRYDALSQSMHELNSFIRYVENEYYVSAHTKTLSPNDLLVISKRLGHIFTWKDDAFKETKAAIKEDYLIGSKELSDAIDIIKVTPEYSIFIGIENYFLDASKEKILAAIKILNESTDSYKEDFEKFEDFTLDELLCINVLCSDNDIRTKQGYIFSFENFQRIFSEKDAICEIIDRVKQLSIRRINETLERLRITI